MNELLKVSGYDNLRKDPLNGGVVNVDRNAYKTHLAKRAMMQRELAEKKVTQETINNMQAEINSIKEDITEVKSLLLTLINKGM